MCAVGLGEAVEVGDGLGEASLELVVGVGPAGVASAEGGLWVGLAGGGSCGSRFRGGLGVAQIGGDAVLVGGDVVLFELAIGACEPTELGVGGRVAFEPADEVFEHDVLGLGAEPASGFVDGRECEGFAVHGCVSCSAVPRVGESRLPFRPSHFICRGALTVTGRCPSRSI